jgi:predicted glycosyltransferase involved in capsule biosynthesis
MASLPCRLKKEINYGNVIVFKQDLYDINGWDESIISYGGDDDDFCHRLKLKGLREINPVSFLDAKQYSILHGDELRTAFMEDSARGDKEKKFAQIYENKTYNKSVCNFLYKRDNITVQNLYVKQI